MALTVHLLDVGPEEYGDAIFCVGAGKSIQLDGAHPQDDVAQDGHPSIPEQLVELRGAPEPIEVDLLVVTHGHLDHIGCLPKLVAANRLRAHAVLAIDPALAWGRPAGQPPPDAGMDERVRRVVAGLREEVLHRTADDAGLDEFLADALNLEQRYTAMLDSLEAGGATVVRLGRSTDAQVQALLDSFAPLGLELLGPSPAQLFQCAEIIGQTTTDSVSWVADHLSADAEVSAASLYRSLAAQVDVADAPTDAGRPGAAINLQSIVLSLGPADGRVLLTGDMQLANPQLSDQTVRAEVSSLRERIRQHGPYRMVKIGHHGSPNAFSKAVLADTSAAVLYGICAGSGSLQHPSRSVLRALAEQPGVTWARTDHNGLSHFDLDPQAATPVSKSMGTLNDAQPNSDGGTTGVAPGPTGAPAPAAPSAPGTMATTAARGTTRLAAGPVEVITRIPEGPMRVVVSIEVEGAAAPSRPDEQPAEALPVAGGPLGRFVFVTRRATLVENVGEEGVAEVFATIEGRGGRIVDLPSDATDGPAAARHVRPLLRRVTDLEGVILLGGYDVVPSVRLDVLPADVRSHVGNDADPDRFIVWNDELYGDRDGVGLPDVPVTRMPDGRSRALLRAQFLPHTSATVGPRAGVRNVARPFAAPIYDALPGTTDLLVSQPSTYEALGETALSADRLYFMLHGDYTDASRYWGEDTLNGVEAVNAGNVTDVPGGVVLAGCCWGALIVETPAYRVAPRRPVATRTPEASIALSLLQRGALAFVGCTGAHYSPSIEPFAYFGGPLHRAFWQRILSGEAPARALFEAKVEYFREMPHGQTSWSARAIEYKIWRQFTCLGAGWPAVVSGT